MGRHLLAAGAVLSYVLLLWTAYQAGRTLMSRRAAVGVALGALGVQAASWPGGARALGGLVSTYLVFVALPLVSGRYLARLRSNQEILAEQERLRERLRIARDMHDSLGRRLSLVSIQAAALEVSVVPDQRQAIGQLAAAARCAMDELHELVGVLRRPDAQPGEPPAGAIAGLTEEFRTAGMQVTLEQRGEPQPLSAAAAQAAYRTVEEGLTNAARHATGKPVTVSVEWEPRSLLLTLANPAPDHPADPSAGGGHGLSGLNERMALAGGYLDYRQSEGQFRLSAMLPTSCEETTSEDESPAEPRIGTRALAFTAAILMFVALPAVMLLGVR